MDRSSFIVGSSGIDLHCHHDYTDSVTQWHAHPTRATAEKSRRFVAASAEALGAFLREFSQAEVGERFPF
jgi:hypothetical protein